MKISEILALYQTDKVNPHTYGPTYDELFKLFNREDPISILEIGTQKGGSLCAWRDYFPNATITGIDIVDVVKPEYRRDDINYIICDINDYKTDEMFDIIIDDGSHWLKDVVHSLSKLSKQMKIGGVFVVEDVQSTKIWIPVLLNIISPQFDYNKGYNWSVAHYNGSVDGNEDNYLFMFKRTK